MTAIVAVFVVLAGTFSGERVAGDEDYVDVALFVEPTARGSTSTTDVNIIIANNGSRTAYDVEAVVDLVSPEESLWSGAVQGVPVGVLLLESIPGVATDNTRIRWTVPALKGGQREELVMAVSHVRASGATFDNRKYVHEYVGEVTTSSFDSNNKNNTAQAWSYSISANAGFAAHYQAGGNYTVDVSADNVSPSPGDTVNFTIAADRARLTVDLTPNITFDAPPIDLKVDIELTGGLSVDSAGTISYFPTANRPASMRYSNGVFNIGTLRTQADPEGPYSVTLPVTVGSGALTEQCLTATLTGNPPPGTGPFDDRISDNVAKLCLWDPSSAEPVTSGQLDAFTIYPCVGNITTGPCESGVDDLRVRAAAPDGRLWNEGTAVIHVDPDQGRIYNGHTQSVNDGNTVSWQTAVVRGTNTYNRETAHLVDGVQLSISRTPFTGQTANWKRQAYGMSVKNAQGTLTPPPPGKVFFRVPSSGNAPLKAESTNDYKNVRTPGTAGTARTTKIPFFLEFAKLGTYKITWHGSAVTTSSGVNEQRNCPADYNARAFCGEETLTFHVGPMADLAVRDGGASTHVAADRNALTIVAVNNGRNKAHDARVTGLPRGAQVLSIPKDTTYNSSTGVWDIGELRSNSSDYYASRGEPEPTLVLSAGTGDSAGVSISNVKNYEVCVGPKSNPVNLPHTTQAACEAVTNASWNSTPVYDHNTDNNTARIEAQKGTGGVGQGAPTLASPRVAPVVSWEGVKRLYSLPVTRYEVQWSLNGVDGWTNMTDPGNVADMVAIDIESDRTRYYRARAVNAAGTPGPWSAPVDAADAPSLVQDLRASRQSGDATRIDVSWSPPLGATGGISYDVEYQTRAGSSGPWGGWTRAATGQTGTSYTLSNADANLNYRFQVRAVKGAGRGPWSSPVAVSVDPGTCVTVLTDSGSIPGNWQPLADCQSLARAGSNARYYTFTLSEQSEVTVDLYSRYRELISIYHYPEGDQYNYAERAANTYLYLRQGHARSGPALHENNYWSNERVGSGRNDNSRIVATLPAGTYTAEATTFHGGETWDFTLTVTGPVVPTEEGSEEPDPRPAGVSCGETHTVGWGGNGGSPFGPVEPGTVQFRSGGWVDALIINGTPHGGGGGNPGVALRLASGEYITHVLVRSGDFVDYVEFITNQGNRISGGSSESGSPHRLENVKVLRLGGRSGDYLDRLEVTYCVLTVAGQPLTPPTLTAESRDYGVELFWNPVPGATGYEVWYVYADDDWSSEWVRRKKVGPHALNYPVGASGEIGAELYNFRVCALWDTANGRESACSATVTQSSN